MEGLGEQGFEAGDQAVNRIRHLPERFEQRFTIQNPRLAERYIKAERHLLLYGGVREIDGVSASLSGK